MRNILVTGFSLALLYGCGSDPGATLGGTGGATNSNANGGSTGTQTSASARGGSDATGGTTNGVGGTSSVGGTSANSSSGATTASGGTRASSGSATGGNSSTSSPATGGKTSAGGTSSSSSTGATNTGGKAAGGTSNVVGNGGAATGGANPTGGSNSGGAGGKSTTAATGGNSNPAGGSTSVVVTACGLPAAGATGKAKPSGTAGGLKVLDWAGFKSAISYTFDDANSSQISNYTAMNATGGKFTFYLWTGKTEASNQVYKTALKDGHEMANHTSDHTACGTTGPTDTANTFIKSTFGVTAYSFAAPNGDAACKNVSSKFLTNRSVAGGSAISPGDTSGFSWLPADIATASNLAPTAGKWRVICIHGFNGGNDGAYQPIDLSAFTSAAKAAVSGGSWVDTVTNIAAYQAGQKAIPASGGNKVTWTLPAIFPTGKCVRVTTTGGTVKQGGTEVPWDDHGYYEISLDAKEVTVE
ncbi:MAG TPA: polysaccharide deacetylase family protein [Polyangiaceae bacterium]